MGIAPGDGEHLALGRGRGTCQKQSELEDTRKSIEEQKAAWIAERTEQARRDDAARANIEQLRHEIESKETALAEERHNGNRTEQWQAPRTRLRRRNLL